MTFYEALNRLASVASICAHSHHEGPEAFSYEWHPFSSLISWAQPHIIEICRSFFFLKDMSSCWKLCALKGHVPNTGPSKKIIYGWFSSWTVMGKRKWRGWEEGYGEWRGRLGVVVGLFQEGYGRGGSSLLIFLEQQRGRGALPELANTFSW